MEVLGRTMMSEMAAPAKGSEQQIVDHIAYQSWMNTDSIQVRNAKILPDILVAVLEN